jgi:predicted Rossmann fold flavoprotein
MKVAIIGAGASGMVAALHSAWNGAAVTLIEHNSEVGKKLLVTGSGRCNLTNEKVGAEKYTCADPKWIEGLIKQFGVQDLVSMLSAIGIPVQKTPDGWYYPLSNSAQSVVQSFSCAIEIAGVILTQKTHVNSLNKDKKGFWISYIRDGSAHVDRFDRVIISAGGTAYPNLGSRGELFPVLERLGHTVLPKRPALAPMIINLGALSGLQGVRMNVGTSLCKGSECLAETTGNIIFTEWGLNGPAVMDLSHHVSAHPGSRLNLVLNFLAFFQDEFNDLLAQKRSSVMPVRVFLNAFFPPKVSTILLRFCHLAEDIPLSSLKDTDLDKLIYQLRNTRFLVNGVKGFDYCQTSAGGIPVNEVNPFTLESHWVEGLYLTGETLDVVGPCGGYNLHFAFGSGSLAGKAASRINSR